MAFKTILRAAFTAVALGTALAAPARAEVSEVRISKGFGILYLPLYLFGVFAIRSLVWLSGALGLFAMFFGLLF